MDRAFTLQMETLILIPSILYGPLSLPGVFPKHTASGNSYILPAVAPKQTKIDNYNKHTQ